MPGGFSATAAEPLTDRPFRLAVDSIPGLVWTSRPDGWIEFLNQRWREFTGLELHEANGWGWMKAVFPEDLPGLVAYWKSILASGEPGEAEARLRRHDGEFRWFLFRATPLRDADGRIIRWYGTNTDIEDRKQAESLLEGERRILELIAKGDPLSEVLEALCWLVEEISPGLICSILLVDPATESFRHGAAPSFPDELIRAVDGWPISRPGGACSVAARERRQVIIGDIATDDQWEELKEVPLGLGLRSCWSTPVISQDGTVLGVFAIYSGAEIKPSARHSHLIDRFTHLVSIAVERSRAAATLQASEHLARGQLNALTRTLDSLAAESELDRFLGHVLCTLLEQLGGHSCGVWRRDDETGLVSFEFSFENGRLAMKCDDEVGTISPTLRVEDVWPWPEVFGKGKPYLLEDIREGPHFPWRDHVLSLGVVSILIVPMLVSGDVKGVIGIRFTRKRRPRPEEIELAQALSNQAMLAIQLTRLSEESRRSAVIAERNRMARDIHDTLAQGFTGVIVQLDAAEDARSKGMTHEMDAHIARANELARDSLQEARRSVRALRPRALDEQPLPRALEDLMVKATAGTALRLAFVTDGDACELPPDWEENLLRIGQEALSNALRHADARHFEVRLSFAPRSFRLELRDDGRGFNPQSDHEGFGLTGMKERAGTMAGKLLVHSAPGRGTVIVVTLPLSS